MPRSGPGRRHLRTSGLVMDSGTMPYSDPGRPMLGELPVSQVLPRSGCPPDLPMSHQAHSHRRRDSGTCPPQPPLRSEDTSSQPPLSHRNRIGRLGAPKARMGTCGPLPDPVGRFADYSRIGPNGSGSRRRALTREGAGISLGSRGLTSWQALSCRACHRRPHQS